MSPESPPVLSALLPWLFAALVLVFAGLIYLILRLHRLERGREALAVDLGARVESLFGHQQLHFVRELQAASTTASDRVMDMVAGETDRLRERLEGGEAASRHALQQLHLALVGQIGKHQEGTALRLAELAGAIAAGQEKLPNATAQ